MLRSARLNLAMWMALAAAPCAWAAPNQFDPTFGTNGVVQVTPPTQGIGSNGTSVCADGSAYATYFDPTYTSIVVKYNVQGQVDPSFDTTVASTFSQFQNLACASDGGVYVIAMSPTTLDTEVHKFLASGALDTAYGVGGTAAPAITTPHFGPTNTFVLDSSGRLVLAGTSNGVSPAQIYAVRLTASGTLDASFGTAGEVAFSAANTTDSGVFGIGIDSASRILVGGYFFDLDFSGPVTVQSNWTSTLTRLTPAGVVDTTYGVNGSFIDGPLPGTGFEQKGYLRMTVEPSGAAYLLSNSCTPSAVLKLDATGTPQAGFGTAGKVSFPANFFCGLATRLGPDGALYLAGYTGPPFPAREEAAILKMSASTGAIDTSYGPGGVVSLLNTPLGSGFYGLAFKPTGQLLAWGSVKWTLSTTTVPTYPLIVQLTEGPPYVPPTPGPTSIPTLSEWGLLLLTTLLGGLGARRLRQPTLRTARPPRVDRRD